MHLRGVARATKNLDEPFGPLLYGSAAEDE